MVRRWGLTVVLALLLSLCLLQSDTRPERTALDYVPRGEASEHRFMVTSLVARWDPCTPIGWRVNTKQATPGALTDTQAAVWRLGQVTGFTFRYRGTTTGVPQWDNAAWFPADTQVVLAWVRKGQSSLFALHPLAASITSPAYAVGYHNPDGTSAMRITRAGIVIDSQLRLHGGFGFGITRGDLLLHELGHAMGLAHYPSTDEMMNPIMTRGRARYGAGDLAGLEQRGARMGCLIPD